MLINLIIPLFFIFTDVHNSILKSVTVAGIEVQCVQYSDLAEGQKSESNKTIEEHVSKLIWKCLIRSEYMFLYME